MFFIILEKMEVDNNDENVKKLFLDFVFVVEIFVSLSGILGFIFGFKFVIESILFGLVVVSFVVVCSSL